MQVPFSLTDLDRRIWTEELDGYVPRKVFDVHTHIYYLWAFNTDPHKNTGPYFQFAGTDYAEATWDLVEACDAALFPGRSVDRLAYPFPFSPSVDVAASNDFVAKQVARNPRSAALMLVQPHMTPDDVELAIEQYGFLGFKPYRFYPLSGDAVNGRLTEFMPEHLIQIADRRGLLIMMHLSKRDAIADPDNIADLLRLSEHYAGARLILAQCGRSYSAWAIEKAARHVRGMPNAWYDTSSVCESDAFDAIYSAVGIDRVMYGSDDVPVGVLRDKCITFGSAWTYLSEQNHNFNLSHCDPRMTFSRYEQLRPMRRAGRRLGITAAHNQALFFETAWNLVRLVRAALPASRAACSAQ